jgi:hypothetical protein
LYIVASRREKKLNFMWLSCCGPWPQHFVFICLSGAHQNAHKTFNLYYKPNTRNKNKYKRKTHKAEKEGGTKVRTCYIYVFCKNKRLVLKWLCLQ